MSTPCCQISTANRLVVFEYEVPKGFFSYKVGHFLGHPVVQVSGRCYTARPRSFQFVDCLFPGADILVRMALRRQLRGRLEKQIWPKVRHCLTWPRPPLPPVKSDTLLKNIFIAFLNSTAFVCYFEMILFFSHPKIRRKT